MKKIIIFIIILIILGISFWYYKNQNQEPDELIGGQEDEHGCLIAAGYSWCENQQQCLRTWEETCSDASSDWRVYNNEKFGFELKFPPSWDGYIVSENDFPDYSYVGFSFRGEGRQPFIIFQVVRYNNEQLEAIGKNLPLKILDQSDDRILFCDGCCFENQDFVGGGQFDEFQIERCKEASEIIKTFKKK